MKKRWALKTWHWLRQQALPLCMQVAQRFIHSFIQLSFSPFIPSNPIGSKKNQNHSDSHSLLSQLKLSSERKVVIQSLELLIIDEISMVRCDVIDAIDLNFRHVRNKQHQTFGGVQLLMIGDL